MESVYERIRACPYPVYLYGTGNGALKIHAALKREGISVRGVFASDGFVRERSFLGFPVETLAAVEAREGTVAAVLCFGLEENETDAVLGRLLQKHAVFSPALPVYGDGELTRDWLREHRDALERVYGWLADAESKRQYEAVLCYRASGDVRYLLNVGGAWEAPDEYFAHDRAHIDVGAYDGDTVAWYLERNPSCSKVLAFEPDRNNFLKLQKNADPRVQCFPFACGAKDGTAMLSGSGRGAHCDVDGECVTVRSLDSVCGYPYVHSKGLDVGSLKIDAEGLDAEVLSGAANLISATDVVVCVSAYHKAYDLLELPLLLKNLRYRSKLYFRRKHCVPDWDSVFYLV